MRKKFFINMQSREISETKYGNSNYFTVFATEEEIDQLRRMMNKLYEADTASFIRAHIPFIPYHKDDATDTYDQQYVEALEFIYRYGNHETKDHIESMGILPE